MRYQDLPSMPRAQAEAALSTGSTSNKVEALLSVTLNGEDRAWVEQWCLRFLDAEDPELRRAAAVCLGHLARLHGELDVKTVLPRLRALTADPALAGAAENAIEDIEDYVSP